MEILFRPISEPSVIGVLLSECINDSYLELVMSCIFVSACDYAYSYFGQSLIVISLFILISITQFHFCNYDGTVHVHVCAYLACIPVYYCDGS